MSNCATCKKRTFDEDLGYYVCDQFDHRIRSVHLQQSECPGYERARADDDIKVGQKVKFDPFKGLSTPGLAHTLEELTVGEIIEVYPEHRWFAVEYKLGNVKQRISFNFQDVGATVTLMEGVVV